MELRIHPDLFQVFSSYESFRADFWPCQIRKTNRNFLAVSQGVSGKAHETKRTVPAD
jgi:hypothetical protein